MHLTFDHNFGKRRPISKLLSLSDSWENFVHIGLYYQDYPSHLMYVSTLSCETWKMQLLPISMAYCMWNFRSHLGRYKATLVAAQVWILWAVTIKIFKTIHQCCAEKDQWCQRTEAVDDWRVTWTAADSHWWSTSEWRKHLWACVCTRDGRFQHLLYLSDYFSDRGTFSY